MALPLSLQPGISKYMFANRTSCFSPEELRVAAMKNINRQMLRNQEACIISEEMMVATMKRNCDMLRSQQSCMIHEESMVATMNSNCGERKKEDNKLERKSKFLKKNSADVHDPENKPASLNGSLHQHEEKESTLPILLQAKLGQTVSVSCGTKELM